MGSKTKKMSKLKMWESISGWLFVLPATILFFLFTLIPILSVIYYSLTKWDGMSPATFVGLANYGDIVQNPVFYDVITNNFKFLLLGVPLWTFFPLVIAILLFEGIKGWKFFRSAFFFPTILSTVVTGTILKSVFSNNGFFNTMLRNLNLDMLAIDWWSSGSTAIPLITVIINWVGFGTTLLIYLAAMSSISDSVIEASLLDGATWMQRVRYIFMPSLKRILQLTIIMNILYCFTSLFGYIYVMTKGGPGYETTVIEYFIYLKAFISNEMGYASALSVMLAVIVLAISAVQFLLFEKKGEKSNEYSR